MVVGSTRGTAPAEFADEAASVLAGAGIRVHMLPDRRPTPMLAFAVRHLSAAAGIMMTASHNPPADNGYKLYLGDGAQIVPPADAGIEARIRGLGTLSDVPAAPLDSPLVLRHGEGVAAAYLDAVTAISPAPAASQGHSRRRCVIVYTPLHGVARDLAVEAIERAGFPARTSSRPRRSPTRTSRPSPFPTPSNRAHSIWRFADARRIGAHLVLANDPDGDRLAVAVPDPAAEGGWRVADRQPTRARCSAATCSNRPRGPTPVQGSSLPRWSRRRCWRGSAAAAGARYEETLTGFKWIASGACRARDGRRFVFGFEEALGYADRGPGA